MLAWIIHGQRSLAGYSPWGHKRIGHNLAMKRQQQWRERGMISQFFQYNIHLPTSMYLFLYLPTYLLTSLPIIYLSIYLASIYTSIYLHLLRILYIVGLPSEWPGVLWVTGCDGRNQSQPQGLRSLHFSLWSSNNWHPVVYCSVLQGHFP